MAFSVEDIRHEIDAINHPEGTWAIDVHYWLYGRYRAHTYYSLPTIYQTEKELRDSADKAVEQHFKKNGKDILKRLADLAT